MTDFDQIKSILKFRLYSKQQMECHLPNIVNSGNNNLPRDANILLEQPVYVSAFGLSNKVFSFQGKSQSGMA